MSLQRRTYDHGSERSRGFGRNGNNLLFRPGTGRQCAPDLPTSHGTRVPADARVAVVTFCILSVRQLNIDGG
jgi:hypothetical protein